MTLEVLGKLVVQLAHVVELERAIKTGMHIGLGPGARKRQAQPSPAAVAC